MTLTSMVSKINSICNMLYENTLQSLDLVVELEANMTIINNYTDVSVTMELRCTSERYPPSCVIWLHNGQEINVSNASVTIKSNFTSSYISTATVSSVAAGNYTCHIISSGTSMKTGSATVPIAGMTLDNCRQAYCEQTMLLVKLVSTSLSHKHIIIVCAQ